MTIGLVSILSLVAPRRLVPRLPGALPGRGRCGERGRRRGRRISGRRWLLSSAVNCQAGGRTPVASVVTADAVVLTPAALPRPRDARPGGLWAGFADRTDQGPTWRGSTDRRPCRRFRSEHDARTDITGSGRARAWDHGGRGPGNVGQGVLAAARRGRRTRSRLRAGRETVAVDRPGAHLRLRDHPVRRHAHGTRRDVRLVGRAGPGDPDDRYGDRDDPQRHRRRRRADPDRGRAGHRLRRVRSAAGVLVRPDHGRAARTAPGTRATCAAPHPARDRAGPHAGRTRGRLRAWRARLLPWCGRCGVGGSGPGDRSRAGGRVRRRAGGPPARRPVRRAGLEAVRRCAPRLAQPVGTGPVRAGTRNARRWPSQPSAVSSTSWPAVPT